MCNTTQFLLYHGSRGGIEGKIEPNSRSRCDFGRGFYMGDNLRQAKTLIATDPDPVLYRVAFAVGKIPDHRVLSLNGMEWTYFVMYNRKKLEPIKNTPFYNHYKHLADGKDLIVGPIAVDALNLVAQQFMRGEITDKVFLECIRAMDYGMQYVAKTEYACSLIDIVEEKSLYGAELTDAMALSLQMRAEGGQIAAKVQHQYRRKGKFFDEVLSDIQKGIDQY